MTSDIEDLDGDERSTEIIERPEPLRPFSVRLRPDQFEYLKRKADAPEWLRDLIDRAIVEEARATADPETASGAIIALVQKTEGLDARIEALERDPARISAIRELEDISSDIEDLRKIAAVAGKWTSKLEFDLSKMMVPNDPFGFFDLKPYGFHSDRWFDKRKPPAWLNEDLIKKNLIQPSDIAKASEAKISALSEARERAWATLDAFDSEIARLKGEKESLQAKILEVSAGHQNG